MIVNMVIIHDMLKKTVSPFLKKLLERLRKKIIGCYNKED